MSHTVTLVTSGFPYWTGSTWGWELDAPARTPRPFFTEGV